MATQQAARESLGIDAIVISGARHGSILSTHRREVAAAFTQGLRPNHPSSQNYLETKSLNEKTGGFESQSNTVLLEKFLRKRLGIKGILFSAVPLLIFVGVYLSGSGLIAAVWSSVMRAIAILLLHLLRREPSWPAIAGLLGVAIQALVAYLTGSGRGFFLLHIWGSLCFGGIFLLSVLLRWPLVGVIWSRLNGAGLRWRADRLAHFYYALATLSWAVVLTARFVVLHWLCNANAVGWLAFIRIVMGHPLAALALLINIWSIRRASAREK